MTFKGQLEGIHWGFIGVLLFAFGVLTICSFLVDVLWVGNVRLLAGLGVGVMLLLVGLVLMKRKRG